MLIMSIWGDMLDRGVGEKERKEDKEITENRYNDSDNVIWKGSLGGDEIDEDIPNQLDDFRWDSYEF